MSHLFCLFFTPLCSLCFLVHYITKGSTLFISSQVHPPASFTSTHLPTCEFCFSSSSSNRNRSYVSLAAISLPHGSSLILPWFSLHHGIYIFHSIVLSTYMASPCNYVLPRSAAWITHTYSKFCLCLRFNALHYASLHTALVLPSCPRARQDEAISTYTATTL